MDQQTDTCTRSESTPRLRDEMTGPPRPSGRSLFGLIGFGLLLTVTLMVDALSESISMPGFALTLAGLMLLIGVAELLDPAARRLVIGVRVGGVAMALLGLVLQVVG